MSICDEMNLCNCQYPSKEYFEQEYLVNGKTREQLAKENGVSVATIKTHLYEKHIVKPPLIDRNVLYDLYVVQQKTMKEIGRILGHSRDAVSRAVDKYGFKKSNNYSQYDDSLDNEWIAAYTQDKMSTAQIAKQYGVSHGTVKKHLVRCGVDIRGFSEAQRNSFGKDALPPELDDYDYMFDLYVVQRKELIEIAKMYACTSYTVKQKLIALNIPVRTKSEDRKGRFCGSLHPNWQGGITPLTFRLRQYFEDWLSPMARQRDGYRCQLCGSKSNLHVHHIVSFSNIIHQILSEHPTLDPIQDVDTLYDIAKDDDRFLDLDNLITYCRDCHLYKIHKYKRTISNQASLEEGSTTIP